MSIKKTENRIIEIRVEGELDPHWSEWFEGLEMQFKVDEGTGLPVTLLVGPVTDQSRLHGILGKIASLNIKLLSVNEVRTRSKTRRT